MMENLESRQLLSTTWYVSPTGSNFNGGTSLSAPFQTIQQAASVAGSGDHVEIETGVYHETVTPAHSGVTFQAYNNEKVTVTGADQVTGWTQYSGSIYSAPVSWNLGEGNNEVFVNGTAINEADWPNSAIGNFSHPNTSTMQSVNVSGDTAVIHDSALGQAAGTWTGAIIHMNDGQAWEDQTGTVLSSSPGSVTIHFINDGQYHYPVAGNQFYLYGKFQALTSAGEWYLDPTSNRLYVWTPNGQSPAGQDVELKHRAEAFNLNGVSNTTIQGVNIFGAGVSTSGGSSGTVINGITATYVSQSNQIPMGWYIVPPNDGIDLMGGGSVIENSTVSYSSNDAIVLGGYGSTADNNVVHDVAYTGSNTAGIRLLAGGCTVSHNTVYNSGRHGILAEEPHSTITYNIIHDVGLQTTEAGGIYTANTNGQGSVIAYNEVYNIHTGGYGGTALFTDNNSSNWIVHNNVTWNVDYSLKMNFTSNNNLIYNNTLGATLKSINTNQLGNWDGVKIYNNIFEAPILTTTGASVYNNAYSAASANSSQGAGNISAGANDVIASQLPSTPPSSTTTTTTTVPLASTQIAALNNDTALSNLKFDNFTGLGYAYAGSWASYTLNFGTGGLTTFTAGLAAEFAGGSIQIRLGSPTGTLIGTLNVAVTGAWSNYTAQSTTVADVTGVQTVYLVFEGPAAGIANLNTLQFS